MRGLIKRAVALPAAALGAVALVGLGAGAAHATTVTSGSITLTVSGSYIVQLARAGVVLVPQNAASVTFNSDDSVSIVYTVTSGNASLVNVAGGLFTSGAILGFSCNGSTADISSLAFNLTGGQFDGKASATSSFTPLVDMAGTRTGVISGTTDTYTASSIVVDAKGAALLDTELGTTAFAAGQAVGSFTATWTTS